MRQALSLICLVAVLGCGTRVDPMVAYRDAARSLRFTIDQIHPTVEMRFPVDRSGLKVHLLLGGFKLASARSVLWLERAGQRYRVGNLDTSEAIRLEPGSRGSVGLDVFLAYQDLKDAWDPISDMLRGADGTWRLEGMAAVDVLGLEIPVPFSTSVRNGDSR
jgi:hypothetical protein